MTPPLETRWQTGKTNRILNTREQPYTPRAAVVRFFYAYYITRRSRVIAVVVPLSRLLMKRTTIEKRLGVTVIAVVVVTLVFWSRISAAFGPMEQHELQCLICHRERVEKIVCGSKVRSEIVTNRYSDWVDSFTPSDHDHVWVGHTSYHRSHWFGRTSIGCGGIATIPRMFEHRDQLGETESQQLVSKFHELVRGQLPHIDLNVLYRFENTVIEDPDSLLRPDSTD